MKKIAFIGAGSFVFTRNLIRDILSFPAFNDATLALMDINEDRLGYITRAAEKIVKAGNYPAKILPTTDREKALEGADGVLCTILNGGLDVWRKDLEIPKEYGVDICIGDTRGPAGIFRALRNIPVMLDICGDIERLCPGAVFLNYTNPMAMLCRAMQGQFPHLTISGLCHSVQGTAAMLARWIGAREDEITYTCAGVNHQAFYLDYRWKGKDAYPAVREAVKNPEIYRSEIVRIEMFRALGYFPTESSGHNSEYNAWFRKHPDLIEKYCFSGTGENPGFYAVSVKRHENRRDNWRREIESWLSERETDLKRGREYAAKIFNAIFGDGELYHFNGNVRNLDLIDNLPYGACVEIPMVASPRGLELIKVGALPLQIAALNHTSAICEEMAVKGAIEGDPEMVFQAIAFDPLTSAVLGLEEIREMTNRMFEWNRDYLPQFKNFSV
jgi:alpha-galactosidase